MKLVCLGASNPETIRVVNAIREKNQNFCFLGFIDNDEKKWGTQFCGYPVLGGTDLVTDLSKQGVTFCNLITQDCVTRYETTKAIVERGGQLTNLIHPTVNLEMVNVGIGNYVQENVITQAQVTIGNNSSIHLGSIIAHETKIGNSVFIAGGSNVSGKVTIGDGAFLGTGVSVAPRLKIGKWSIIGTGSVVVRDVPAYKVIVGNPGICVNSVEEKYISGDVF